MNSCCPLLTNTEVATTFTGKEVCATAEQKPLTTLFICRIGDIGEVSAGSPKDTRRQDTPTPDTVCSPGCRLTRDTEVSTSIVFVHRDRENTRV